MHGQPLTLGEAGVQVAVFFMKVMTIAEEKHVFQNVIVNHTVITISAGNS